MIGRTVFRQIYDAAAVFALLNTLLLAGGLVYLAASGSLSGEKLRQLVELLSGTPRPVESSVVVSEEIEPPAEASAGEGAGEVGLSTGMQIEIMRREAERIKEELRQRLALNNSILLRVQTEREAFERQQAEAARLAAEQNDERGTVGFEKQIEILEGLKPAAAMEHLLGYGDVEEAANVLMAMDTRKAQKIVQAAREPQQMRKMMEIMQRLREVTPEKSDEIEEDR